MPDEMVPARYIGTHVVDLQQIGRQWINIDGTPRHLLKLTNGDTVMMPSEEILGKTILIPKNGKPLYLGVGRVILPEHKDVPVEELGLLGYQFDAGRPDFEPVEPDIIHKHHKKSKHEINDSITVNIAETEEKK